MLSVDAVVGGGCAARVVVHVTCHLNFFPIRSCKGRISTDVLRRWFVEEGSLKVFGAYVDGNKVVGWRCLAEGGRVLRRS